MERLFRASCPRTPVSPENRSHGHFWPATGRFRPPRYPLCRGADVLEGFSVPAGVNYPERSEERARPCAVDSPGPPGSSPVERAGRKEPREPAVQPGLAPVTRAAEPVEVLQGERPPERLGSHRPGDVDGEPVVELRGRTAAALAHRDLDAEWLLSGCDAVGRKAVVVPGEVYGGGVLVAPATDAADRRLAPARGPCYQSPGMRRRVSPVVQHQSPETSPSHPVPHALHAVIPPVRPAALSPTSRSPIRPGRCVRSGCPRRPGPRRSPSRVLRSRRRLSGLVVPSPSATP